MRFLSMMGNSFGCSASGERLVSAARDGDFQEAKALLECNPRLARYSTIGVRNSPLHCSAAQGHHEIVFLLLESGVDIDLRNTHGQTALMQACCHGHWEVVQILMLFRANIHKTDYLNSGTAIHYAALNGHTRCIRLLVADCIPSIPDFWHSITNMPNHHASGVDFDDNDLVRVVNKQADGGITALHMAALNGHAETVHLLLDLGAYVSARTVEDRTAIDLVGPGSTPLHYAACGGNLQCCQLLIARGASLETVTANGWNPLMVARLWRRSGLEDLLSRASEGCPCIYPSPYLSLPLMSIISIARECGLRNTDQSSAFVDPCSVCLERKCTVFAEGCQHEFCTNCALYLCSTARTMTTSQPPGSIPCPLCRHSIVSFVKLACASPIRERPRSSLTLSLCAAGTSSTPESEFLTMQLCNPRFSRARMPPSEATTPLSEDRMPPSEDRIPSEDGPPSEETRSPSPSATSSFRSLSCHTFCMGLPKTSPSLVDCSRTGIQRSASHGDGHRGSSSFSLCVTAAGS